jgi:hypothetical protein
MGNAELGSGAERAEVGYKRPPREHQFKKGHKPPPRKKKEGAEVRISEILRKVLHEPRRVAINGKVCWVSGAEGQLYAAARACKLAAERRSRAK